MAETNLGLRTALSTFGARRLDALRASVLRYNGGMTSMMPDLLFAFYGVTSRKNWVIVVVPSEQQSNALTCLVALAGTGALFGGHTLVLTEGGRLTVLSAMDPAPDGNFEVMFVGWGDRVTHAEEMNRWRKAANQVLTRSV